MSEFVSRTDTGRERDRNEDSVLATELSEPGTGLLVVADGMGGHQAGDVASEIAVEAVSAEVADALPVEGDREAVLGEAIATANERIQSRAAKDGTEGMGTTVVAALVDDGTALVANVGDSRAYVVDDGPEQVTVDQNLAREMVEEGALDEAELDDHPHRHVLAQALGTSDTVEPEFSRRDLDGGTLLLCSDGLPEEVDDDVIATVVEESDSLEAAADALVKRANENGGSDNVSAVLYSEADGEPDERGDAGDEAVGDGDSAADEGGAGDGDDENEGALLERVRGLLPSRGEWPAVTGSRRRGSGSDEG
jgi:serine/threonine protein phosphatase PrpC